LIGLEGALRVLTTKPDIWADDTRVPFQKALMPMLNLPWQLSTGQGRGHRAIRLSGPPIYGCWYSAVTKSRTSRRRRYRASRTDSATGGLVQ